MRHRHWWLIIAMLGLLGLALAVHEATRPAVDADVASVTAPANGIGTSATAGTARTPADAAQRARYESLAAAVTTLHAYLAALFEDDRSAADAYWIDGAPTGAGEDALRALTGVTGIRADNTRPEPLDTADLPEAVEIPVRLRIGGEGPLRHYAGHYRLRRVGDDWRITSASIEPSPRQR